MTPITELTVISAPKAIFREFLEAYFDGALHDVGARSATFPKANIAFGQGQPAQPLNHQDNPGQTPQTSAEIRVLCLPRSEALTWNTSAAEGEHLLATDSVLFQFQIRARKGKPADQEALGDQVAQLLKAILTNPDTRLPLARVGVTHLTPLKPLPVESPDYALRLLNCPTQLQYPIQFGAAVPGAAVISTLSWYTLVFTRENPLVIGESLLGDYTPPYALEIFEARISAWLGTTDAVLALSVGGVDTGVAFTIPGGTPNTDWSDTVVVADLPVPAGALVQLSVQSAAADIAHAPWHVTVSLRTRPA